MNHINDEPFKIGEEVILINLENYPEYNNTKAEVIGNLTLRKRLNMDHQEEGMIMCYKVRCFDGLPLGPRVDQIKPRLKPPLKVIETEEVM
jgi:hypothetical protein